MNPRDLADATAFIAPSQLRIGLYVHLDLNWTEHPFAFSNFKLRTLDQIATIQGLGLDRLRYSPARSDAEPLPVSAGSAAAPAAPARSPAGERDLAPAYQAKRNRQERLEAYRARIAACQNELAAHARIVRSMERNLHARPAEVRENACRLVDGMLDSMLLDADIAIHLMADQHGGERLYHHPLNVTVLAMMLGRDLRLPAPALRAMALGAMFHDVGLLDMPGRIARARQPLADGELAIYRQHTAQGVQTATKLGLPPDSLRVVAEHHEQADGRGYPRRLKGPQISRLAQVVAIADQFDELCNPVDRDRALTPHEALSTLYGQRRDQFDNAVLMAFVRCMGVYPPGTIVELSNAALGMVVSVNSSRPLKPTVLVCDLQVPKSGAIVVDLEQVPEVSILRTLSPQQLSPEQHDYLSPRQRTAYYFSADAREG